MDPEDKICTDGPYSDFEEHEANELGIEHLRPHHKKDGKLPAKKAEENKSISGFRRDIEQRFADQTNKFAVISQRYRHNEETFNFEFRLGEFSIIFFKWHFSVYLWNFIFHL